MVMAWVQQLEVETITHILKQSHTQHTQVFWHVTLPNIRWGLLYGVILTNARAMGEFGAVSVISGAQRSCLGVWAVSCVLAFFMCVAEGTRMAACVAVGQFGAVCRPFRWASRCS